MSFLVKVVQDTVAVLNSGNCHIDGASGDFQCRLQLQSNFFIRQVRNWLPEVLDNFVCGSEDIVHSRLSAQHQSVFFKVSNQAN